MICFFFQRAGGVGLTLRDDSESRFDLIQRNVTDPVATPTGSLEHSGYPVESSVF